MENKLRTHASSDEIIIMTSLIDGCYRGTFFICRDATFNQAKRIHLHSVMSNASDVNF